jgi:hypothetical protein
VKAREAISAGCGDLSRARAATAAALLGTVAAALAVEVMLRAAGEDLRGLFGDDGTGQLLHAILVLLLGAALSSLLFDSARAVALTAYARPGQPWLLAGLSRVPGLLTVGAMEVTIQSCLVLGLLKLTGAAVDARSPLAAALAWAPVGCLCAITFGAARIAQVLVARGVPPSAALVHGCDFVLRRISSLVRLALVLALWTLPLTVPAVLFGIGALVAVGHATGALAGALGLALFELAALVGYAALAQLVGRDPRLITG